MLYINPKTNLWNECCNIFNIQCIQRPYKIDWRFSTLHIISLNMALYEAGWLWTNKSTAVWRKSQPNSQTHNNLSLIAPDEFYVITRTNQSSRIKIKLPSSPTASLLLRQTSSTQAHPFPRSSFSISCPHLLPLWCPLLFPLHTPEDRHEGQDGWFPPATCMGFHPSLHSRKLG